ncbi:Sodium Bile acid symporter family protein [Pseudovibrio axinellae]|uniref:Sodium Bile acid symporter family protein n=1 Tax=Pseudovibrio axinellae TaxID=989403 RepID=A0A165W0G6_9HYPH|nr:bile acid:sodium symporter family protein [Pseudovibrio axinellae]KZL15760.1 Sodium Bile acid symporter family protein [Pseudovibrio axinellae]SEQ62863.1 bile acid:Na+ symporter, BASS family [Pseudovibrio axinellae]
MDILIKLFLPLSLAFIMFSLGITLTLQDFKRVVQMPRAFSIGMLGQLLLLPVIAFTILQMFDLEPAMAFGVMLLAFAPGGVSSNMLTRFSGGSVALAVSLTAVTSLLCVLTVPLFATAAAAYFLGAAMPEIDVTSIGIAMALITAVPVAIGVFLNHLAPTFIQKTSKAVSTLATVLFVVIVVGAVATNWSLLTDNILELGPVLILLNMIMLLIGYAGAKSMKLSHADSVAIAMEVGIQNATLGITVGALIAMNGEALPPYSLASGIYGITMYGCAFLFILWARRKARKDPALQVQNELS